MKNAKQLREERKAKFESLKTLIELRKTEKRDFTTEEQTLFDTIETEIEGFDTRIMNQEKVEKAELRIAASMAGAGAASAFSEKEERDLSKYSLRSIMNAAVERQPITGLELEMHQEGLAEMQRSGASPQGGTIIPEAVMNRMFQKRNQTATGGSAGDQGGLTVETNVTGYVEALRERSLLLQLGTQYLTGMVGNFDVPVEGAVFAPSFKTEIAASDKTSATFGKVSFNPKRLSGHMDISRQLLIQSSVAIENLLRNQMILGHATAIDKVGFNGAGGVEPTGLLNDSLVSVLAIAANGGALTQEILDDLDLIIRNKKQYEGTSCVTNATVRRALRNLKIDAGSGLFVWDRSDNQIDGKPAFDTTHVPANLTKGDAVETASAFIEGNFSDSWFCQWGGTELLTDPYTQAVNGMVRLVSNQYVDFNVVRKDSFAVIKDIV